MSAGSRGVTHGMEPANVWLGGGAIRLRRRHREHVAEICEMGGGGSGVICHARRVSHARGAVVVCVCGRACGRAARAVRVVSRCASSLTVRGGGGGEYV